MCYIEVLCYNKVHGFCATFRFWATFRYRVTIRYMVSMLHLGSVLHLGSGLYSIVGDFNHLRTTTMETDLDMTQLISFPTRDNATLDKIYTNSPVSFVEPERLSPLGRSDHCCILVKPSVELPHSNKLQVQLAPIPRFSSAVFWLMDYQPYME